MNITTAQVKKIAALARLGLSAQEVAAAQQDLANILRNFSQIQKIDTSRTPTSDDVTGLKNVTRADQAIPGRLCSEQILLENAPTTNQDHIQVPAVF